jgi:predicted nucleic acid-binding protein
LTILIDSSVWIDFFNGKPSPAALYLRQELGSRQFLVGDLILAEVLQGFRNLKDFQTARTAMLVFPVVALVGPQMAMQSAQNYRLLRSRGKTVRSTIDCLIASYCIANEYSLLHADRDYSYFEEYLGLHVLLV